jgi:hypothetical protein
VEYAIKILREQAATVSAMNLVPRLFAAIKLAALTVQHHASYAPLATKA